MSILKSILVCLDLQLFTPPMGHLIFSDLVLNYQKQMPVEFLEGDTDIFVSLGHTKPNTLIVNSPGNFIMHTYSPIVVMTNKNSFFHSFIHPTDIYWMPIQIWAVFQIWGIQWNRNTRKDFSFSYIIYT